LSKVFGLYAKQSDPQNRAGLFASSVNIVAAATIGCAAPWLSLDLIQDEVGKEPERG